MRSCWWATLTALNSDHITARAACFQWGRQKKNPFIRYSYIFPSVISKLCTLFLFTLVSTRQIRCDCNITVNTNTTRKTYELVDGLMKKNQSLLMACSQYRETYCICSIYSPSAALANGCALSKVEQTNYGSRGLMRFLLRAIPNYSIN